MTGRRLFLNLSWLWPLIVIVYMVWGGITQTGLYYWVGTLEVDALGSYAPAPTGMVPGFLLALPALWPLAMEVRRERLALPDPAASARARRIFSFILWGLGAAGLAAALVCFLAAQNFPSGAEPAVPFDASALGSGPVPAGKVLLTGTPDASAQVSAKDGGRFSDLITNYAGFRVTGDRSASLRLFIEHRVRNRPGPAAYHLDNEQSGYLVENDLPPLIVYAFQRRGTPIASPHYLLRTSNGAFRDPYYTVAGLGLFFGCIFMLLVLPKRGPGAAR